MSKIYKSAYYKGIYYLNNKNYTLAREQFEIARKSPRFQENSLYYLIRIDLKEGKFASAREILTKNQSKALCFKEAYGALETCENNFIASRKSYRKCLVEKKHREYISLALSRVYLQLGEHQTALQILEYLQENENFNLQATYALIYLYIRIKNYDQAAATLRSIDTKNFDVDQLYSHNLLDMYIKHYSGIHISNTDIAPNQGYIYKRLTEDNEDILIDHITKHKNQELRDSEGCFFADLDLSKLILTAKEHIENLNPNYFSASDVYRFHLDHPIGYKGKNLTNDLCVVTFMGIKNIVTMFPVSLSSSFDKEGYSTKKDLTLTKKII